MGRQPVPNAKGHDVHRIPSLLGLWALDENGDVAGFVDGTYPDDGSTPEFAHVRLLRGRFPGSRLIPLDGAEVHDRAVWFPLAYAEMEDAPDAERRRWPYERVAEARAHWPQGW
jgi:hypothetical protein